jgi:glycosyltransferase involved in cell wall biosynthesis
MKLAVVMPIYNAAGLLTRVFDRVAATPAPLIPGQAGRRCDRVIILVDDGSTDGSRDLVRTMGEREGVVAVLADRNRGKGAAIRLGLAEAIKHNADLAIIQDADLEYDPADHAAVLTPILDGRADAVIGTRFMGQTHRVLYYWHQLANRVISTLSNMLSNLNLSDIECGFKAFSRPVLDRLDLIEDRFGIEPEIVARLARMRLPDDDTARGGGGRVRPLRIYEVPVSYSGRTYAEGKKIGWRDGFEALWCIVRHNLG